MGRWYNIDKAFWQMAFRVATGGKDYKLVVLKSGGKVVENFPRKKGLQILFSVNP